MTTPTGGPEIWPDEQRAIWQTCRHPTGAFVDFPASEIEQSIPERFATQVRHHARRPAVIGARGTLSYEALDRRANAVADGLLALGGRAGEHVALLLERDVPLVVALLGVLKAGKVYVPMDASLPDERLAALVAAASTGIVVTDRAHADRAAALARRGHTVLDVDALAGDGVAAAPAVAIAPGADAVLLYTSGSTARPKGVVHTHRNVLQMVMNHTRHLHICAEDRLTLLFSSAFVGSLSDVFGALLNGAAMCPIDVRRDGMAALAERLDTDGVTIYHSVTSTFRQFMHHLPAGPRLPAVRLLHVGGEPVTADDLLAYRARFAPGCVFLNMLGTTETGNFRIYFVDKTAPLPDRAVPVGYAFADKDVLLLDDSGLPVPPGSVGEIVVRSRYLSSGYWGERALTDAAFSSDPDDAAARRYRTGDLGSLRADGCLEHHGRKDQQVKIRGYRVETAAVEAALLAHPVVKEVAVVAQAHRAGGQRLVAYLVPAPGAAPSAAALREFAAARLADYMVPSAFVVVDALPLTHTGKVDRQQLPPVARVRADLSRPFAPPRSPLEAALAALWASALDLDAVGIHDPFIDLGGDSLLALRLVNDIHATLRVSLPQAALLNASTVEAMAHVILESLVDQEAPETMAAFLSRVEGTGPATDFRSGRSTA